MKRAFAGIFLLFIVGLSTVCKGNDEICREAEEQKGFFPEKPQIPRDPRGIFETVLHQVH